MTPHLLLLTFALLQGADEPTAVINRELTGRWQTEKLTPAAKTNDYEFLRRASLDLIGRIPTLAEQDAFHKDTPDKRRIALVDRLLAHEDHARHWANLWTAWLFGNVDDDQARRAFHGWLQAQVASKQSHKEIIEKLLLAKGSTRDHPAVHFFVALRGQPFPKKQHEDYGQYDMKPLTGHVFRVLHANRLQCVQCHDHPFLGEIGQHHFHEMNLFFKQVAFNDLGGKPRVTAIEDDSTLNKNALVMYERPNSIRLAGKPRFYNEAWDKTKNQTRREFFTERFIKHSDFARGHVSFVWAQIMGRGLTTSREFDDLGEHNLIVHPKIMDRLAAEFVKSGHDSKALLRWICSSDAYQLKSVANRTNDKDTTDVYFSRMQARRLSTKQLAEAVIVALTGENYVKRRDDLRRAVMAHIPRPTWRDMTHCEIEPLIADGEPSIVQALWLMNGPAINQELIAKEGTLAQIFKRTGPPSQKNLGPIVKELYKITLCRPPTMQELTRLQDPKFFRLPRDMNPAPPPPAFFRSYCEDIFWALLNCNEFAINH